MKGVLCSDPPDKPEDDAGIDVDMLGANPPAPPFYHFELIGCRGLLEA